EPRRLCRGVAAARQGRRAASAAWRPHGAARGAGGRRARGRGARRLVTLVAGSAFVSGGGSGVGRAIALAPASPGAAGAVLELLPEGGKDTVAAIAGKGGRATFVQGDVSRWDDVDRAVAAGVRELGTLAIVVNAAGVRDGYAPADELGSAVWERVVGINLTGTFYGCKRALAELLPRRRGRIVHIASVARLVGSRGGAGGGAAYTASKHGVVGLTRQLAITYAARGITVNAICPGAIQTSLRENSTRILGADAPVMRGVGGDEAAVRAITPAGRRGTLEEIAAAARYLAGSEAGYVPGPTLLGHGGGTAP